MVVSAHIGCANFAVSQDLVDSLGDLVGVVVETEVAEHHSRGKDHGSWVGNVLSLCGALARASSLLEKQQCTIMSLAT